MKLNPEQRKLIDIEEIINEASSLEINRKIGSPNRRVTIFFFVKTRISLNNLT